MAPLESRREPGTADPAATETSQISSDKPTPTKSADPDCVAKSSKKATKQKCRKKHPAAKSKKSKSSKKPQVVDSDSDESSEDAVSSSDDSDDNDDSESEVELKKSKRLSRADTKARRSRKTLKKKGKKKLGKAAATLSSESESDDDLDEAGSEAGNVIVENTKSDKSKRLKEQQGTPDLSFQQLQQLAQLIIQGQSSLATNSAGLVPGAIGQAINPDASQLQAATRPPYMQQLVNAQLDQAYHRILGQPGRSETQLSQQQSRPGSQRGRNLDGNKRGIDTEEVVKSSGNGLEFKRVDQVWDSTIHNYKLKDTTQSPAASKYEGFLFHVRRTFDWEGKYKTTYVDIKSKELRECLRDVIGDIKGVSLVEESPKLDPNLLFLYLDDLRKHLKVLKKTTGGGLTKKDRKKEEKRIETKRSHLKALVKYVDKDYAEVKRSLYPMLENGLITFDMLWALWKPSTLVYTATYGCHDEPRAFKVGMAEKHHSMMRGDFYWVEGKYFEYDGKQFGYGTTSTEIPDFQGARKITSLPCYPLKYHKDEPKLVETLIERGKKFARLGGVHYKSHQGMAFFKKKKAVVKVNINGRVMVDPAIHRRINPNYQVSVVRPKDHETGPEDDTTDDDDCYECSPAGESDDGSSASDEEPKYVTRLVKDKNGNVRIMKISKEDADKGEGDKLDAVAPKDGEGDAKVDTDGSEATEDAVADSTPIFSDEEYLISSPVVLGFAFSEKLWLEFTVSGIKEIQWNEGAYESLVLEPKTKDIVKALVESHKYHAAESIDDVIQGKGKGLVAVLHGPPGTGKTLTAEGISELLKCPLYMASAGELGTDSRLLEGELQKILDICHAWGAILLLDEADVFLEKRNMHDIHRNALVSIFLRQLEYFQGILFLTTNRVETFDDAFQSRIHLALRYDPLDAKAKRAIFKIFVERVRVLEKAEAPSLTEEDYNDLARHDLNGRQIKNTVRTAQALAVNKGEPLGMRHIRQVLDVHVSFDRDLKGGVGYQEAMRSYF